jgi:broad specificity phosphatase PhoE
LRRFAATDPDGTVVVVSHGGVTVDFLRSVIDDAAWTPRIGQLIGDGVPGGAITEVSSLGGVWRLQRLACLDHLVDADRSGHRLL